MNQFAWPGLSKGTPIYRDFENHPKIMITHSFYNHFILLYFYQFSQKTIKVIQKDKPIGVQPEQNGTVHNTKRSMNQDTKTTH